MNNKKKRVFDFGDVLVLVGIGLVANGFWVNYSPLKQGSLQLPNKGRCFGGRLTAAHPPTPNSLGGLGVRLQLNLQGLLQLWHSSSIMLHLGRCVKG